MKSVFLRGALLAAAFFATTGSGSAGTISCGLDVKVTLNTSTTATCNVFGNGDNLNGNNDPINQLGYLTLDTTTSNGLIPLTFTLGNSGTFSFTALAAYTSYILGIQTTASAPKPDYFSFNLPSGVVSGSYSINDSGTSATGAVLYGIPVSPVPGPIVGAGLPGILMAFVALFRWRRRATAAA